LGFFSIVGLDPANHSIYYLELKETHASAVTAADGVNDFFFSLARITAIGAHFGSRVFSFDSRSPAMQPKN
jgi:hypothetical protein